MSSSMVKSDNKFGKTPVQLVLDDIIKIIKSFYSRKEIYIYIYIYIYILDLP
jgi:hypothetical protein